MRAFLLLNGNKVAHGANKTAGSGRLEWPHEGLLSPATAGLTVVAVDRAGNRSGPVPVVLGTP